MRFMPSKVRKFLRAKEKRSIVRNYWNIILTQIKFRGRFRSLGKKTMLIKPIRIIGPERISLGNGVQILNGARFEAISSYGDQTFSPSIEIGDDCLIGQNFHITACGALEIGKDTTISGNVLICDNSHDYQTIGKHVTMQPLSFAPTKIGENSFIGYGACILQGAVLGKQTIVGANSVVVKGDYPDFCVLAGSPAKIVKQYDPAASAWKSAWTQQK